MARELFADEDFHQYICEEPCTVDEFSAGLVFNQVVLRDAPRTLGCIALPLNQALTRIYGVFVLDENVPNLVLSFYGLDIRVDPSFKKPGFKDLLGSEQLEPGKSVTHRYVWNSRGYELRSTTKAGDAQ